MPELCDYDNKPAFENGMCEDCYSEDEYMRQCGECFGTGIVVQGNVNAFYKCELCGARWM